MDKQVNATLNKTHRNQPYWPALKLILSSLIVFNFYFHLIKHPDIKLIINAFNLSLIPMFVLIVAFVTKETTWPHWRQGLVPALIIYFTFQSIDAIPLYFSDSLDLKTYLLSPQNGVWFFLATPIWQSVFLLLPPWFKKKKSFLFITLLCALLIAYKTKHYISDISGFFAIVYYFPFFILAYFITPDWITRWRAQPVFVIMSISILALGCLYYQIDINTAIVTRLGESFASQFIQYILSFLIGMLLGSIIIYFASASEKYEKITNNALGIYLIHPVICFVLLEILSFGAVQLSLPLVIILALFTISLALWLASNRTIHWFINPILGAKAQSVTKPIVKK